MTVDILEHEFVPSHEVLSKKDAKELATSLGIEMNKFPKMFLTDPVAKIINAKLGDVIKITRKSPTAGETTYYRIVV